MFPLLADLVVACAALAPPPDPNRHPNPPPVRPPPPQAQARAHRPNLVVLVPLQHVMRAGRAGMGRAMRCDTELCQWLSSRLRRRPAVGRRCARLPAQTGPALCVGEVGKG